MHKTRKLPSNPIAIFKEARNKRYIGLIYASFSEYSVVSINTPSIR